MAVSALLPLRSSRDAYTAGNVHWPASPSPSHAHIPRALSRSPPSVSTVLSAAPRPGPTPFQHPFPVVCLRTLTMSSKPPRPRPPPANARFTSPSSQQLRALVLDYLCHKCYIRTARAFACDSIVRHLDADGDEVQRPAGEGDTVGVSDEDLNQVELRRDVQTNILSGRVDNAIELLDTHFPSVLARSPGSSSAAYISPIPASSPTVISGILPSTVEPAHLYLDLRVLAFIEASRTTPMPPPQLHPGPTATAAESSDPTPPDPLTVASGILRDANSDRDGDAHLESLLAQVYELYDCAQALADPADRAGYQNELSVVSSLLAYKVPERSPMARYLNQDRRQAVADEINSAILYRAGRPSTSYMELYIRYTTVLWNYMNENEFKLPPPAAKPGLCLPPRRRTSVSYAALPAKDNLVSEVVPPFDLHEFLSPNS
ncbi:hypothetical protein FA95DRAFT_1551965 [Auriscalpium vulgare]|uniref:Uncharacterized protein n=1 Tax=Auriscalpium vulgare TaxID=40419 RepID=A0ACB8SDY8_9AGAM|nr:hypothetical protein FA95DRAFT_1551965 [Auriscalpium vulgare]